MGADGYRLGHRCVLQLLINWSAIEQTVRDSLRRSLKFIYCPCGDWKRPPLTCMWDNHLTAWEPQQPFTIGVCCLHGFQLLCILAPISPFEINHLKQWPGVVSFTFAPLEPAVQRRPGLCRYTFSACEGPTHLILSSSNHSDDLSLEAATLNSNDHIIKLIKAFPCRQ